MIFWECYSSCSSRLQPDQKRLKQETSHSGKQFTPDLSSSTTGDAASKESKLESRPALDLAPPISEGEELSPEEVQMVGFWPNGFNQPFKIIQHC